MADTDAKTPGDKDHASEPIADLDPAQLDALLYSQDPTFKEQMTVLKSAEIKADIAEDVFDSGALESLDDKRGKVSAPSKEEKPDPLPLKVRIRKLINKMLPKPGQGPSIESVKQNWQATLSNAITSLRSGIASIGTLVTKFKKLTWQAKLSIVGLVSLAVMIFFVGKLMFENSLLPDLEMHFIPTVAAHADQSWEYPADEQMDDFYSSMRHPENVVLLERLVVNVRPSENSGPNPMGFFEFYIEASSDAAAIEINDRKAEVKDAMQRTIEDITYDDLVTTPGKNKLKLVLRKNINVVLTKGRVRKIFFKSIVVKP